MKIGIVGHGAIGSRHAANARKLGHQTIVYDPTMINPKPDVRFERMIYDSDVDAVVIATPSYCHEAGLRACIERGKHALVEKPISTSLGQLAGLLLHATTKNLVIMMGNNLRFHPCVIKAEQWLSAGLIGAPLWAQFTCAHKSTKPLYLSDGVILNTGAHEVDLAMHLLGAGSISYASARLTRSEDDMGGDDIADFGMIHQPDQVRSSFHLDFVTPSPMRHFTIVGDEGAISCNLITRYITRTQTDPKLTGVTHFDNYASPTHSFDDDYLDEMTAFIDQIEGRDARGASGSDGYVTLGKLLDIRRMAGL